MNLFEKLKGDNAKLPPKHSIQAILIAWLGGFLSISAVTLLSSTFSTALVLKPDQLQWKLGIKAFSW